MRALKALAGAGVPAEIERIPVEMATATSNGTVYQGHMQLIDNEVDIESGTVRVRAVFDNHDGSLIPGQFARLRMGRAATESAVVVSERAVGADQDKQFVMVVGANNKAAYREVKLGASTEGLRIVTEGLKAGERVVVNGLQRIRPDSLVEPRIVPMLAGAVGTANDS
jgi:multidrug efflux system membrane fusion protein